MLSICIENRFDWLVLNHSISRRLEVELDVGCSRNDRDNIFKLESITPLAKDVVSNRFVGHIQISKKNINEVVVGDGLAQIDELFPKGSDFLDILLDGLGDVMFDTVESIM